MFYYYYTVGSGTEEGECPQCYSPLYVGDRAWEICVQVSEVGNEVDTHSAGYCSKVCASKVGGTLSRYQARGKV